MGKGSTPRPIADREDFRRRWSETFDKKEQHNINKALTNAVLNMEKPNKRLLSAVPSIGYK